MVGVELPWVQVTDTKGDKMTRTDKIVEDVNNHYNNLVCEHKKLHDEIEQCQFYAPDDDLKQLKMRKLKLKDEIQNLQANLKTFTK